MEPCGLKCVRTFHLSWDNPIAGTERGEAEYELARQDWELDRRRGVLTRVRAVSSIHNRLGR
jgi:hypothetical protein